MNKRITALLLSVLMLLSLTACGTEKKTDTDAKKTETDVTVTQKAEETKKADKAEKEEIAPVFGNFVSKDIEGNEATAEIFKGKKVTMVNVWTTYCSFCIKEMPDLEKLSKDYADKGVQIIGIVADAHNDEMIDIAKDVLKQTGVTYTNVLPSETLNESALGGIASFPCTIFVDENGIQIGGNYLGSKGYDEWAAIIDGVLENV